MVGGSGDWQEQNRGNCWDNREWRVSRWQAGVDWAGTRLGKSRPAVLPVILLTQQHGEGSAIQQGAGDIGGCCYDAPTTEGNEETILNFKWTQQQSCTLAAWSHPLQFWLRRQSSCPFVALYGAPEVPEVIFFLSFAR